MRIEETRVVFERRENEECLRDVAYDPEKKQFWRPPVYKGHSSFLLIISYGTVFVLFISNIVLSRPARLRLGIFLRQASSLFVLHRL